LLRRVLLGHLAAVLVLCTLCQASESSPTQTGDAALPVNAELWQGHRLLEQGRNDLAAEAFAKAAAHASSSPYPHFVLARLYLKHSVMDAMLEFGTALKLMTSDFASQSLALSNLLLTLLIAVGAAFYVGLAVILARHARTIWCSILLTFSPVFGDRYMHLLIVIAVVCICAILSALSPLAVLTWLAILGSGLAWRYVSASERRVMMAFAAFMLAFVPLVTLTATVVSTQHPDSPTKIAAAAGSPGGEDLTHLAETNGPLASNSAVGEFMRGLIHLRQREYEQAIRSFNGASRHAGNNAAVMNNIAVALHGLGRYREAEAKFQEALRSAPDEALIHYNYSQTLNALMIYDLAQEELSKASSLDFDLTRSLVTSPDKPSLVPMHLDTRILWTLAMHPDNKMLALRYHPIEVGWVGLLVLAALTASAFMLVRRARLPARCDVCRSVINTQVGKRKRRELLCAECRAIKQANADSNERLERSLENRVARLATRRGIVGIAIGLLVPGSTYHLLGYRTRGILISIIVFSSFILMASGGGLIKPIPRFDLGHSAVWATLVFLVIYALYAWRAIRLVLKRMEKE
jgi:Tfp pilus assembly protein PilF